MASAGKEKVMHPGFSAYLIFAVALAVALFLVEGVFDVSLPTLLKAAIVGVGFGSFTFTYRRFRSGPKS